MKTLALVLLFAACGYSSKSNELIGQVKKVVDKTPVLCGDYVEADVSLGIVRNGVGSMSKEDLVMYVPNAADIDVLKKAAESGSLVKIAYDVARWPAGSCVPVEHVTHAEEAK